MRRLPWILLISILLAVAAEAAWGQEMLSRPDVPGHEVPTAEFPEPRDGRLDYVDVAALLAALSAASYFAVRNRSRKGMFLLTIASLAYFGFWREGCVCSIGSIQNVVMAVFDRDYAVSLGIVAFFALPLLFTLFFGRTFCAAVCPLGAIQELVSLRPVKVPVWLDHALGLFAYVYLGAAVLFAATGTAFVICQYDPFVAMFRLTGSTNMLVFGTCFLIVGLYVGRPYCRYLCPYGAILAMLSKASKWHLRIPPEDCIHCRLCEDSCPYGAIRAPTVEQSSGMRRKNRRRLLVTLALAPGLVALGAWLGGRLGTPLSKMHPEVRLAERIRLEETGKVEDATDASDAFRETGRSSEDLYAAGIALRGQFASGGLWLGGWVGLVIGLKLIQLSLRRQRSDYQPDPAGCVSCGRCFWYCPCEQVRLGLIENVEMVVKK